MTELVPVRSGAIRAAVLAAVPRLVAPDPRAVKRFLECDVAARAGRGVDARHPYPFRSCARCRTGRRPLRTGVLFRQASWLPDTIR